MDTTKWSTISYAYYYMYRTDGSGSVDTLNAEIHKMVK